MHCSAYYGHVDVCNLLLNTKGINVNSVDKVSIHYTCDVCVCDSVLCCIVQQSCPPVYNYLYALVHLIVDIKLLFFTGTWLTTKVNS